MNEIKVGSKVQILNSSSTGKPYKSKKYAFVVKPWAGANGYWHLSNGTYRYQDNLKVVLSLTNYYPHGQL